MTIEVQEMFVEVETRFGPVKKQHGHSRVLSDGELVGYVPIDGKFQGVFHPLREFPREMDAEVVKNCGAISRSIREKKAKKNVEPVEQSSKSKA